MDILLSTARHPGLRALTELVRHRQELQLMCMWPVPVGVTMYRQVGKQSGHGYWSVLPDPEGRR